MTLLYQVVIFTVPTKGNLIIAKNTLKLAKNGYELLDKKRNILLKEMMDLIQYAKEIQSEIDSTFGDAYDALRQANISMGIGKVEQIARAIPVDRSLDVHYRSVMGVEIPIVAGEDGGAEPSFGFFNTDSALDIAYIKFIEVKNLTQKLAQVENSVYLLAESIKKTQKRANALKNILIPKYERITKEIQNSLEEKEREEFARLKVIKKQ